MYEKDKDEVKNGMMIAFFVFETSLSFYDQGKGFISV